SRCCGTSYLPRPSPWLVAPKSPLDAWPNSPAPRRNGRVGRPRADRATGKGHLSGDGARDAAAAALELSSAPTRARLIGTDRAKSGRARPTRQRERPEVRQEREEAATYNLEEIVERGKHAQSGRRVTWQIHRPTIGRRDRHLLPELDRDQHE